MCLLVGFFGVAVYVIVPATCIAILGVDTVRSSVGVGFFMYGVGFLIGPPMGGKYLNPFFLTDQINILKNIRPSRLWLDNFMK